MNYQDFQILVDKNNNIRASSSSGEVSGELRLEENQIKLSLQLIESGQTNSKLLKALGNQLYQALFPDKINALFHATKASAQANKYCVRLRLIFQSPELASFPWEFLYDEDNNIFLANNTETVLSRYIDVPLQKRDIKAASLPLKVLLVISTPTNLSKLDVAQEEKLIREALGKHIKTGDIELDVLPEATIRNINQKLREKSYNVFHFIGHGVFKNNKGYMALVDTNSKSKLLDDESFANLFLGNSNVGLVVLNSCQGAAVSSNQIFAGTAANLVRCGIPAVVAMQYSIFDNIAKIFADEFYRTLALGYPVDAAIQTTRNAISIEVGLDKRDFGTPVLYMRAKDGIILKGFSVEENEKNENSDKNQVVFVEYLFFDDTFYSNCYKQVEKSGALIRLKAPSKWGKTYLMTQIIQHGINKGYNGLRVDFQEPEKALFNDLKRFLRWFCGSVAEKLDLPDKLDEHWREQLAANGNCTNYLERYLLQAVQTPLILGLDNFDVIFGYESIARDFLPLVRSWHENSITKKNTWGKLRLVIAYSKENYIPIDRNKSPLNAGRAIRIPELSKQQILRLVEHYSLDLSVNEVDKIMSMLGGHPYLINIALEQLANYELTLEELLINAATDAGIYGDYLSEHLSNLKENSQNYEAMKQVVTSKNPVRIETEIASKLRDMGLIKFKGNDVIPLCHLYQKYFSEHLR